MWPIDISILDDATSGRRIMRERTTLEGKERATALDHCLMQCNRQLYMMQS
jgi:hypothetical protein